MGEFSIAIESGDSLDVGTGLRQELEGHFKKPVKYWFLTHTHTDHRKGMDAFKDVTFIASQKCIDNMPRSVRLSKLTIESFDEKLILEEDDHSLEFHLVAGHTIGSSVAYVPSEGVLFGGDLFIVGSVNFGLPCLHFYQNRPKMTGNPEEYITAYEKFRSMELEAIVPGHGDIVQNPNEYLDDQISFFKSLKSVFISAIEEGCSLEEIELPRLEPIEQAYTALETHPQRSAAKRFLIHYLNLIKLSFYNYYSAHG